MNEAGGCGSRGTHTGVVRRLRKDSFPKAGRMLGPLGAGAASK